MSLDKSVEAGKHFNNALVFHIMLTNWWLVTDVARLRGNLMRMLDVNLAVQLSICKLFSVFFNQVRAFSKEAKFTNPCLSFVLPDVIWSVTDCLTFRILYPSSLSEILFFSVHTAMIVVISTSHEILVVGNCRTCFFLLTAYVFFGAFFVQIWLIPTPKNGLALFAVSLIARVLIELRFSLRWKPPHCFSSG